LLVGGPGTVMAGAIAAPMVANGWVDQSAPAPVPPRRERTDERHLAVVEAPVRTPAQRRRRARAVLVGGAAVVAVVAFSLVYLHVLLAQRQFKIDQLNKQLQQEQSTYQALRLQVAQLGSPSHIISTAEGVLGMVQPAHVTYLTPSSSTPLVAGSDEPSLQPPGTKNTQAPAGDADWPQIKAQLAGAS
jgi:cell division protein FtsL